MVTKLDRLARSVQHLLQIVERLTAKRVTLRILTGGEMMDTATATGKMMLTVLGAIAEFELAMMRERQREGIAKAKTEGKYNGRAPTAQRQAADVLRLAAEGVSAAEIGRRLGMHRASVYRIKEAAGP